MKRSLSFIEVIITFFLITLVVCVFSFGFLRYYREKTLQSTQERVETLLAQADYLSTILQQETEVVLVKNHSSWQAILKPWGDEEIESLKVFRTLPSHFLELKGTQKVFLNDTEISRLCFVFLPMKGIDVSYVTAKDTMDCDLNAHELGLMRTDTTITTLSLCLEGNTQEDSRSIDLFPYVHITSHISLPQEYQDAEV